MSTKSKFSFKNTHAIKADVGGIKKKNDTVLLAEFFLIKNISSSTTKNKPEFWSQILCSTFGFLFEQKNTVSLQEK